MMTSKKTIRKAQSILEYILVSAVFASVGIGLFVATNMGGFFIKMGTSDDYHSNTTMIGAILDNGVDPADQVWPDDWQEGNAVVAPDSYGSDEDGEFLDEVDGYDDFSGHER